MNQLSNYIFPFNDHNDGKTTDNVKIKLNNQRLYYEKLQKELEDEIKSIEKNFEDNIAMIPSQVDEISHELKANFKNINNPFKK